MTAEVVDLKARREENLAYWRCGCGCLSFYARDDGDLECCRCENIMPNGGFWRVPEGERREIQPGDGPEYAREDMADSDQALDAMLRFIDARGAACVILLQQDGCLHVWGKAFKSRERRGWLRRRLDEARKMLIEQ